MPGQEEIREPPEGDLDEDDLEGSMSLAAIEAELKPNVLEVIAWDWAVKGALVIRGWGLGVEAVVAAQNHPMLEKLQKCVATLIHPNHCG